MEPTLKPGEKTFGDKTYGGKTGTQGGTQKDKNIPGGKKESEI